MASIKVVLRKEQKADGSFPLAIRIIKDRKPSYIYLDYRIKLEDWDEEAQWIKKSSSSYKRLNNFLIKKLSEATDNALEIETKKPEASAKAIQQKIKPKAGVSFFSQAEEYLKVKRATNYNIYMSEKPRIKHFRDFLQGQDLAFSDLTVGLLQRFETWLKTVYKPKGKKKKRLNDRSVINHFVTIRSVCFRKRSKRRGRKTDAVRQKRFQNRFPGNDKNRPFA